MGQPYIGEIRMFGGNFPPVGWAFCDGQSVPISENDALFTLIGTTYGGDGQETFNLPNLQSRSPMHQGSNQGQNFALGEMAGVEQVTLTVQQMPAHNHPFLATNNPASTQTANNNTVALTAAATIRPYGTDNPLVNFPAQAIGISGGSQPHDNMQPFLCVNFIISLFGIFPTQS
jgi:microcystin-dependent protein